MSHAKSVITAIVAVVIAFPLCASADTIGNAAEPGTPSLMLGAFLLLAAGMFRRKKTR